MSDSLSPGPLNIFPLVWIIFAVFQHVLKLPKIWTLLYFPTAFSVQFSRSVVSDSLQPHELKHTRPPCPSPTPGVHPNSCPSSWWCHLVISSSVVPFSSCPQSLPASESFPMSQLFAWGGQSTGVSALASFFPKNTQDWFPILRIFCWLTDTELAANSKAAHAWAKLRHVFSP